MRLFLNIIFTCLFTINAFSREIGETEITTDEGIEVFQKENFYLLKKNVKINSDNFVLNADKVRIDFKNNLYDIVELNADGNVRFDSEEFKIRGVGDKLKFQVKIEKLKIVGNNSQLTTQDVEMFSDGFIEVNNISGEFSLKGLNSKMVNENILIIADTIDGVFNNTDDVRKIIKLNVIDDKISYIKNNDTEMFAKKIYFSDNTSIIELIDSVTVIRDGEKISGDYGTLDTKNNSYKIKSNNKTKVKVIIQNNE